MRATELVLRRLLPMAYEGLAAWGVERSEAEHYLGIIEGRCLTDTNGAEWFVRQMAEHDEMERYDAIRRSSPSTARDARQRPGPHAGRSAEPQRTLIRFQVRHTPVRGSCQLRRVTITRPRASPSSAPAACTADGPGAVDVVGSGVAAPGEPQQRDHALLDRQPEHGLDDVGPYRVVERAPISNRRERTPGTPTWSAGGKSLRRSASP